MDDNDILNYNFWPSFADLMLSLTLVLVITMFIFIFYLSQNNINLKEVQANQNVIVEEIAKSFTKGSGGYKQIDQNTYEISFSNNKSYDIRITNDAKVQHVTFGSHILFALNDRKLNPSGIKIIKIFGEAIKKNISRIAEIQIQGHADILRPAKPYNSNLELAALRSIEVFYILQKEVGIDPAEHYMSITSFGEYKPVKRSTNSGTYSMEQLKQDNKTQTDKQANRRIEVLIFYK